MRPQVGKRANKTQDAEKEKTLSREFIEKNLKKNLAIREEYLSLEDIKTAININAIEQRIYARNKILHWLKENYPTTSIIEKIEEENHFDRHRMNKML
jgi:intein-encoded DNA endonuclease-like protein